MLNRVEKIYTADDDNFINYDLEALLSFARHERCNRLDDYVALSPCVGDTFETLSHVVINWAVSIFIYVPPSNH